MVDTSPFLGSIRFENTDEESDVNLKIIDLLKKRGLFFRDLIFCGVHTDRTVEDLSKNPQSDCSQDQGILYGLSIMDDGSFELFVEGPVYHACDLEVEDESSYVLVYRSLVRGAIPDSFMPDDERSFRDHLVAIVEIK